MFSINKKISLSDSEKSYSGVLLKIAIITGLVFSVQNAVAEKHVYPDWYIENFSANGNIRTIVVQGKSLNQVHIYAANNFSRYLENDFKNSSKAYTIKPWSFKTSVKKTSSGYEMAYSIELLPVNLSQRHICVVDMRWSVVDGKTPEQTAKSINQDKLPKWQKSMREAYGEMQFLGATAKHTTVYHEAFLGLGICK